VTLRKDGQLRGCIGRFEATEALYLIVRDMAISASTQDYRFPAVTPEEIDDLEIEISVLTPMRKISSIDEIQLGQHGIYIKKGYSSGTFLPQVATETGWTKEEFLGHCARDKAHIGWDGWKDAEIFVYEAYVFSESELE
jgi:AmmeMemoRadiSam system protein A